MLDETRTMSVTVKRSCGWKSRIRRLPTCQRPCSQSNTSPGRTAPASSASAIENGFSVLPGSKPSTNARARYSELSSSQKRFGSKPGASASARISPVIGSSATSVAWRAPVLRSASASALSAKCCSRTSSASWIGWPVRPSAPLATLGSTLPRASRRAASSAPAPRSSRS